MPSKKPRIHIYLDPDLYRRVAAHARQAKVPVSHLGHAALAAFLDTDAGQREAVLLRRLDRLSRQTGRLERNLTVATETLALFIQHQLAVAPPLAPSDLAAAGGYGSLAAGADILFAEALVAKGVTLNCVLPFPPDKFCQASVLAFGEGWLPRFHHLLDKAQSLSVLDAAQLGNGEPYHAVTLKAFDILKVDAEATGRSSFQLAISDGKARGRLAGTAGDINAWRDLGGETIVIPFR